MPRDANVTRAKLLDAGRARFAEHGVYTTPLKVIVDDAGQRNTSALHYHFGGRRGLLTAIIAEYNEVTERRRAEILDEYERSGNPITLERLVDAFIDPWIVHLGTLDGRQFLAIISQLSDLYDDWGVPRTPPQALRCMTMISERMVWIDTQAIRHERMSRVLGLAGGAIGSRARRITHDRPRLDQATWVANLKAMILAALTAPAVDLGPSSPPDPAESR